MDGCDRLQHNVIPCVHLTEDVLRLYSKHIFHVCNVADFFPQHFYIFLNACMLIKRGSLNVKQLFYNYFKRKDKAV